MLQSRKIWTRDELIVTFNLYLKLPFGQLHKNRPEVQELAQLIGRSVNSIALRLVNFAACDPILKQRGIKGMVGGIKQCKPIWDDFFNDKNSLLYESEFILEKLKNNLVNPTPDIEISDDPIPLGLDTQTLVKKRVNQFLFRKMVLSNYNFTCAISGIDIPDLLVASHIIPWSVNKQERLNPKNGICLSSLYDKAFDSGLIGIDNNFKIILSKKLKASQKKEYFQQYFSIIENKEIEFPQKYMPDITFLQWHLKNIFKGI